MHKGKKAAEQLLAPDAVEKENAIEII